MVFPLSVVELTDPVASVTIHHHRFDHHSANQRMSQCYNSQEQHSWQMLLLLKLRLILSAGLFNFIHSRSRIIVLNLHCNYIYSTLGIFFLLPVFYCTLEYCVSLMQCTRVKYLCLHCVFSRNVYAMPLLSVIMVIQSPTENCSAAF